MDLIAEIKPTDPPQAMIDFTLTFTKARERRPDNLRDFDDVHVMLNDVWSWALSSPHSRPRDVPPNAKKFYEYLCIATGRTNMQHEGHPAATIGAWRQVCIDRGMLELHAPGADVLSRTSRTLFDRHKRALIEANWIACNGSDADSLAWTLAPNDRPL